MRLNTRLNTRRAVTFLILIIAVLAACDDQETTAVVDDRYSAIAVYRAWWLVTVFADPVAAESSSESHRVVAGAETAYFILAPGWDPAAGDPPTTLIVAKTKTPLQVEKGHALHIAVDDANVVGNCAAGEPLTQADADFITQRIFAGEFAGTSYDAATCTFTAVPDGGDAGDD